MVSPSLNPAFDNEYDDLSPLPWVARLPSMAAAKLEREGRRLSPEAVAPIEAYAKGEFLADLMAGPQDAAATQRVATRIADLFGLDPALVQSMGGRVDAPTLLRELYRRESKIGSKYDINVTIYDPFPWSHGSRQEADPIIEQIIALTTSAMVDYDTRVLRWKVDAPYQAFNRDISRRLWRRDEAGGNSVAPLRQAMAVDPTLRVLIVHGYTDLSSPFFASRLIIDQLPPSLDLRRIALRVYAGGHMFYSRAESRAALYRDVQAIYAGASPAPAASAEAH
jgi:carboxypeptidase C (cathepsin A)